MKAASQFRKRVESILKVHGLIGAKEYSSVKDTQGYPMMYLGLVVSEIDPNQSGQIQVMLPHLGEPAVVNYSTPYHGKGGSGFWSVPEIGTVVLVAQVPDGDPSISTSRKYIYISSIVDPDVMVQLPGADIQGVYQTGGVLPDPDIYKARARPMKYVWKSPKGHAFTMSDLYDPTFFNTRIEMRSSGGKSVVCDDSPEKDCILLQNEHGDHIKIASAGAPPIQQHQSIDVYSRGNQNYETKNGSMDLRVVDGANLDIVNTSTGLYGPPGSTDWGKVNIMAQNNDITITANEGVATPMADIPSIFITTNGNSSLIQINSRGKMEVQINKSINIVSESDDINIVAEKGDINITSVEGDIKLSSGGNILLN